MWLSRRRFLFRDEHVSNSGLRHAMNLPFGQRPAYGTFSHAIPDKPLTGNDCPRGHETLTLMPQAKHC